jgi:hypothetical protein
MPESAGYILIAAVVVVLVFKFKDKPWVKKWRSMTLALP